VVVVADNVPHPKSSMSARFQGRREVVVVADNTLPIRARFRGWRGGGVADNMPPSKSSMYARFRGQREVVVIANTPPLFTLVFEGGGMCSVTVGLLVHI